jgi:hypothetical protein
MRVETYVDKDGVEKLWRIRFDSREIEVAENIDQWHGADYLISKSEGAMVTSIFFATMKLEMIGS